MTGENGGSSSSTAVVAGRRVVQKRSLDYSAIVNYSATEALETLKSSQMAKKLKEEEKSLGKEGGHHRTNKKDHTNNNNAMLWQPPSVVLSSRDKAAQLTLSKDQLVCIGAVGGYRMIRSTHGVHSGRYYWEAQMLPLGSSVDQIFGTTAISDGATTAKSSGTAGVNSSSGSGSNSNSSSSAPKSIHGAHVRVGWSTRQGELQGPVGFDKYSYGYRDARGSKVHDSVREDDYGEPYLHGDIIGCCISLNDHDPAENYISFYKNGVDQKRAYESIPSGVYFPAVSIYMDGIVSVNFGPSFIFKPPVASCTAVSELQPLSSDDRKAHMLRIGVMRDIHLKYSSSSSSNSSSGGGGDGSATGAV